MKPIRTGIIVMLLAVMTACGSATTPPVTTATAQPPAPQSSDGAATSAEISGTISYMARIGLPSGSIVNVQLLDVTALDSTAPVLGEYKAITNGEQVPLKYTITYDPSQIQPEHHYSINATITIEGKVTFRTTQQHPVLTNGAPNSGEIMLDMMP